MNRKPDKMMIKRSVVVMVSVVLALSIVSGASLFNIMILKGEEYQNMASEQQLYDSLVSAPRGDIYDSNMNLLATSATAWTVYITPNGIKKLKSSEEAQKVKELIAENLSRILDMDYDTIYGYTEQNSYYVIVKKKIEKSKTDEIREFISANSEYSLNQYVGLDETTKRYYPNDSLASVVLGFVGSDDQGLAGLESYYDNSLTGIAGRIVAAKNAAGTDLPFTYEKVEEATKGNSLVLSIDSYIQYTCEKYLDIAVEENKALERGVSIVMNANTGAILGMAVKGDYDPNEPFALSAEDNAKLEAITDEEEKSSTRTELLNRQWRNKAVSDTYEPGSVFKIFTAAVALEENLISEKSTYNCSYVMNVSGQIYHCHKVAGHGVQTLSQAISNSCNPAFITIGQLVGTSNFSKYFKAFGLTERTGIDLPGEASPNYHLEANMGTTELASSSFGQTFNLTAIQTATLAAAAVNGGYLVQPHVVSKILDDDGNVVETTDTSYKRQVISEETSATMRKLLQFVSENGAKNSLVAGYNIGAKTGTSQNVTKILSTGKSDIYIGSCVTAAPIEKPEIIVLTLIDEPTAGQYYGGAIAAPVCSSIMSDILPYLGYEPQYTEDQLDQLSIPVPDTIGEEIDAAKSKISNAGLTYRIVGTGENVVRQIPESGASVSSGGLVILYTSDSEDQTVIVPDFTGMTATEANTAAASAGINIEFSGNTTTSGLTSYKQSIGAGTSVAAGTVVTVYFMDEGTADIALEE